MKLRAKPTCAKSHDVSPCPRVFHVAAVVAGYFLWRLYAESPVHTRLYITDVFESSYTYIVLERPGHITSPPLPPFYNDAFPLTSGNTKNGCYKDLPNPIFPRSHCSHAIRWDRARLLDTVFLTRFFLSAFFSFAIINPFQPASLLKKRWYFWLCIAFCLQYVRGLLCAE